MGQLKFIIAGGGTGGHIFPAIAIANALKKFRPDADILFVGAKGKMEMEKVPKAGYPIEGLDIAGFNRSSLISNLSLPWKLIKSFIQVSNIFKHYKPDAVIGVGGYSSYPVLKYAQQKRIPSFIHESNSFAGKSNQMLARQASMIFVGTDGMEKFFPPEKIMLSGNPVRETIEHCELEKDSALKTFGLDPFKKTVLSLGGSLGARSINDAVASSLENFEKENIQLIWQTGKQYAEKAKQLVRDKSMFWTSDFINEMDTAYAAADLVVSRSGAMSVAELCTMGKPAILVPYPMAAEDHQTMNAMHLVNHQAAVLVKDEEVKKDLMKTIVDLLNDEKKLGEMGIQAKKLAKYNAAGFIAIQILEKIES